MVSHPFSRDLAGVRKRMQDKPTDSQYTINTHHAMPCHTIPYHVLIQQSHLGIWTPSCLFIITFHYLIACCATKQQDHSINKMFWPVNKNIESPFFVGLLLLLQSLNCMFWHFARFSRSHRIVGITSEFALAFHSHSAIELDCFPFTMPLFHISPQIIMKRVILMEFPMLFSCR